MMDAVKRSVNAAEAATIVARILAQDLLCIIANFNNGRLSAQEFVTAVASNGITQHQQLGAIDHALLTME